MRVDCVVQCENIFSIDRNLLELDRGPTGVLDPITLRAVVSAIGHVLDSNCELN
jgi:mRNA-degrading endonuclease toxin of MazEF toxin-antitoxin module